MMREHPHNIEAEQALLGALLVDNACFEHVEGIISAEDFYEGLHASIFTSIVKRLRKGQAATPITLKDDFREFEPLNDTLQVWQYVGRLAYRAATTVNAKSYAETVRDLALRRKLIMLGEDLANEAFDGKDDASPAEIIEKAEQSLFRLAAPADDKSEVDLGQAITSAVDAAHEAYQRNTKLVGLSTGYDDLDRVLGGLSDTDLVILAGRPSMGKTALAVNIATNVAKRDIMDESTGVLSRHHVGFFSLEMSAEQLATRILAERTGIPSDKIRRGDFAEQHWPAIMEQMKGIAEMPIHIEQTGGISIANLATRARRMKRRYGIKLLVIDYLQLLTGTSKKGENRTQEVTEITGGLKALAKELRLPVIALSQLSRKVEERSDKRPQLSDLRESGSIEQDADVVMFVYRDEYYVDREKPDQDDANFTKWQERKRKVAGTAEILIPKNRHGRVDNVKMAYDGPTTRFSSLYQGGGDA